MMMSVDVTNHNGPAPAPPTSLSLRSSHNQLLSGGGGDAVVKQGQATPPKCRKKYALTSIQAAMGLGEAPSPGSPSSPLSSTPSNPKLAKNGVNQLRKAGQDHNKNTTGPGGSPELESEDLNVNKDEEEEEEVDCLALTNNDREEVKLGQEVPQQAGLVLDSNINASTERNLNGNPEDPCLDVGDLSEKEIMSKMKIEEDGDEEREDQEEGEEEEKEVKKPLLVVESQTAPTQKVSLGLELVSNLKLLKSAKDPPVPPPPSPPKQVAPEEAPLLPAASRSASSSSSSSPETKKDRRTGAKTDCALNRIQNLNPSDEELSWTTLSQESNSPEETGTHTHL